MNSKTFKALQHMNVWAKIQRIAEFKTMINNKTISIQHAKVQNILVMILYRGSASIEWHYFTFGNV